MHSRASHRALETWSKATTSGSRLAVHFRTFGSTGGTSAAAATVSHKQFNAPTEIGASNFRGEKYGPRTYVPGEDPKENQSLRARPSFRSSSPNRARGKFREVHVALKVRELCEAGKLDEALECCKTAPTGVQAPAAWNTVIRCTLDAGRYNFAYQILQQMKKRAVKPSSATYMAFLSAYAKANPEALTPVQLEHAQKFYKAWVDIVLTAPTPLALKYATVVHPAAAYINVLSNAKSYQAIWDTFYELSPEGPLAPDQYVFTCMFVALAKRDTIDTPTPSDGAPSATSIPSDNASSAKLRNAQDAKLLWRMTVRALERQPFLVDSYLLTAVLRALQGGGEAELELALSIINDYVGLRTPDAPAPTTTLNSNPELEPRLLDASLAVYNLAKRPDLTRHFVERLMAPEHPQRSAVTTGAMNHLLKAYASQGDTLKIRRTVDWMLRESAVRGGLKVAPGSSTWCLAFRACLSARDWDAAKGLTKRLAGTVESGRTIDTETIYMVLKSAYVLKPDDERQHERQLRQALDAVYYVVNIWPKDPATVHAEYARHNPGRVERRLVFQNALADLVKQILGEFDGLNTISVFHDLAFRLDNMRTDLSEELVARYKKDM